MLRITIELIPLGIESAKQHLSTAEIWNDGSGTTSTGNYKIRLSKKGNPSQTWKTGEIQGFKRQKFGPWDLLALCLLAALGETRLKQAIGRGGKS